MKYLVLVFILFTFTYGSTDPLIASYDKGLDLILIDTTTNTDYLSEDLISYYRSLYKDVKSDLHYLATLEITNNILYTVDSNYTEKRFNAQQRETIDYVGSLSKYQRVYSRSDGRLYLKTLTPFKDDYYLEGPFNWSEKQKGWIYSYTTNELTTPVIPCTMPEDGESFGVTYYTNTDGMMFSRRWNFYKYEGTALVYIRAY